MQSAKDLQIYVVPCGGTVLLQVQKQKTILMEQRHIHKPSVFRIELSQLSEIPGKILFKVYPDNIDEASRTIHVEIRATTLIGGGIQNALPRNLSLSCVSSSVKSCNSVDVAWNPVTDSRAVRYCILVMTSSDGNFCSVDQKIFKHPLFQQLHCFYSKLRWVQLIAQLHVE